MFILIFSILAYNFLLLYGVNIPYIAANSRSTKAIGVVTILNKSFLAFFSLSLKKCDSSYSLYIQK